MFHHLLLNHLQLVVENLPRQIEKRQLSTQVTEVLQGQSGERRREKKDLNESRLEQQIGHLNTRYSSIFITNILHKYISLAIAYILFGLFLLCISGK